MGECAGGRYRQGTVGQATVGAVLVIALVIVGSTAVLALGDQALTDTEQRSDAQRAQQAMTLFDSQTAQVALSESDRQTVRFGRTAGTYSVDPTAGKISIINVDRDDDGDDNITWTADGYPTDAVKGDDDGDIEYIHNETLGAVVYDGGDRTIAYQGGGVWQKDVGGGTRMISPPEFHYRAQTLTLPIIQVEGEGAAGGSARATVSKGDFRARSIYPNASDSFDNGSRFRNPVENGSVIVRIESDYARAWGSYFEERTEGVVTYPADGVVAVKLISLSQVGEFDMPLEGGSVTVPGVAGAHSVEVESRAGETAFSIRLRPDDADSADFANLQWSLYADEGDHEFEMHLKKAGSGEKCSDGTTGVAAHLTIYYSWNEGDDYHGWRTTDPIGAACKDLNGDDDDEIYLDATFVDDDDDDLEYDDNEGDDDVQLEFQSLSSSDLEHFSPNGDLNDSRELDGHSAGWEAVDPTAGSTTLASDQLVNHYFAELPEEFDFRVDDKGSDTTNEGASSGTFYNSGSGRYVTYLHVTSNQVEVEVED